MKQRIFYIIFTGLLLFSQNSFAEGTIEESLMNEIENSFEETLIKDPRFYEIVKCFAVAHTLGESDIAFKKALPYLEKYTLNKYGISLEDEKRVNGGYVFNTVHGKAMEEIGYRDFSNKTQLAEQKKFFNSVLCQKIYK